MKIPRPSRVQYEDEDDFDFTMKEPELKQPQDKDVMTLVFSENGNIP